MTRTFFKRTLLASAVAFAGLSGVAHAQLSTTPYVSNEGISSAQKLAKDSLGSDLILRGIATGDPSLFTSGSQLPVTLEPFDLETGKASAWGYNFYGPTKKAEVAVVTVKIIAFFQSFPFGPVNDSITDFSTTPLDLSGPYANSDQMVKQLKNDTAYVRYRAQYPQVHPAFLSFGMPLPADTVDIPNGFPKDQPLWLINFIGQGDSTMSCLVASKSGQALCIRFTIPDLAVPENQASSHATMAVVPNPSSGRARITIATPDGSHPAAGTTVALYNLRGEKVLDLTESYAASGYEIVEFDSNTLPAGPYYCRAAGGKWVGTVPVMVEN